MRVSLETDLLLPDAGRDEALERLRADLKKYLGSVPSVNEFARHFLAYAWRRMEAKKLESWENIKVSKEFDNGFVKGMESLVIELETWMRGE